MSYLDVLKHKKAVGDSIAIIGAGGIGFDVAEYLSHSGEATSLNIAAFMQEWGIDMQLEARGGIEGITAQPSPSARKITLMQRKAKKVGNSLGKTTGWIHRLGLQNKGVEMLAGCEYLKIDDQGLHYRQNDEIKVLDVDNIIICAGQEPRDELAAQLNNIPVHLIGGAQEATELDAKRAIDQGTRLAVSI